MPRQQVQPHGRPLEFARIVFITLSSRRGSWVRPAAAKLPHGNMIIGVSLIEGEGEAGERVDPRILVVSVRGHGTEVSIAPVVHPRWCGHTTFRHSCRRR